MLGSPFLHVRFNAPDARILPETSPSRDAFDRLASDSARANSPHLSSPFARPGPSRPGKRRALYDYSRRLAADPRVTRVESFVDVDPRLTLKQYQLLYARPAVRQTVSWLNACRNDEG